MDFWKKVFILNLVDEVYEPCLCHYNNFNIRILVLHAQSSEKSVDYYIVILDA